MIANQMIRGISFTILTMFVLTASACSTPKDEPMPLTKNTIEKFYKNLEAEAKNVDQAAGTDIDRLLKIYKPAMNKTGYSLEKTLRYLLLNVNQVSSNSATVGFWRAMGPAYMAAVTKPDEALQKGLIDQKMFTLVTLGKEAGESVSDMQYKLDQVQSEWATLSRFSDFR